MSRTKTRPPVAPPEVWRGEAACRTANPDLFYREAAASVATAKKLCRYCSVQGECLAWAVANHEAGVWGGTTDAERERMRRRGRRG